MPPKFTEVGSARKRNVVSERSSGWEGVLISAPLVWGFRLRGVESSRRFVYRSERLYERIKAIAAVLLVRVFCGSVENPGHFFLRVSPVPLARHAAENRAR
ncbi:hypothetical protein PSP6_180003 [Paraburkholderia tropica]|nr:hypothetical protein PSP6_180003 [Paraburkholderia tropica]